MNVIKDLFKGFAQFLLWIFLLFLVLDVLSNATNIRLTRWLISPISSFRGRAKGGGTPAANGGAPNT